MEDQGKRILLFVLIAAAIFVVFQWVSPAPEQTKKTETAGPAAPAPTVQSRVGQPAVAEAPPVAPAPAPGTPTPGTAEVPAPGTPTPGTAEVPAPGTPTPGTVEPVPPVAAPPVAPVAPPAEETLITLDTKAVRVSFSNIGGVVKEWRLMYDPYKGRVLDEPQFLAEGRGRGLLATNFVDSTHVIPFDAAWTGGKVKADGTACAEGEECHIVRYTYRDSVLEIVKTFELLPDDYLLKVHVDVRALGGQVKQNLALSMFSTGEGIRAPLLRPACHLGSASSKHPDKLRPSDRERTGRVRFVGFARKYSLIALSPEDEGPHARRGCFRAPLPGFNRGSQVDLVYYDDAQFSAADKGGISKEAVLYVGPKYFDRLEGADEIAGWSTGMKSVIDLGWFSFIARPMLWLLNWFYDLVGNWGIAIILLTILVKLATLYWTTKSMRSMKAMAALKPEMEAIQKRYPDDRAKQQQAQMALFKQHGVSPLAGCLPMLLQMPVWIALYRMLSSAGELHQATFIPGWLDDLTQTDPFYILPITLTGMMFLQSKLQPATGDSMQQKILMYGMPIMFGGMSLFFPSGLTVYIFTNTVLGILHSMWMNRTAPAALAKAQAAARARAAAAAAKDAEAGKLSAEVRQAKKVTAEVADSDDDGDDEPPTPTRRPTDGGKNGAAGGQRRSGQGQGQRRGKRRQ